MCCLCHSEYWLNMLNFSMYICIQSVARNVIHYLNLNGIGSISGKVRVCGISLISTYAKKQLTRTELLLKRRRKSVTFAIPVILTLHSEKLRFINKVPIIPISEFASFLRDFEWNIKKFM